MRIRPIDQTERAQVQKYLMLDEALLYSLIPPYLPEHRGTAFAPKGQVAAGRKKVDEIRGKLHEKICGEWQLCDKIEDAAFKDAVNLVVVVGDAISAVTVGIPPVLVASLLVKIGLRKFCGCTQQAA